MSTLAQRIKELRLSARLTGEEFGRIIGVTKAYVSYLEKGERDRPSAHKLAELSRYFSVNQEWLETGIGPKQLTAKGPEDDVTNQSNTNGVRICPPSEAEDKKLEKDKILHRLRTREEELSAIAEELQSVVSRLKRLTGVKI